MIKKRDILKRFATGLDYLIATKHEIILFNRIFFFFFIFCWTKTNIPTHWLQVDIFIFRQSKGRERNKEETEETQSCRSNFVYNKLWFTASGIRSTNDRDVFFFLFIFCDLLLCIFFFFCDNFRYGTSIKGTFFRTVYFFYFLFFLLWCG